MKEETTIYEMGIVPRPDKKTRFSERQMEEKRLYAARFAKAREEKRYTELTKEVWQ